MYLKKLKEAETGYTFDDFLLLPQASYVEPKDVETGGRVSRNIELKIPIISSAMDTVTEYEMATAMAQEGGIGVIHRNMSIRDQVEQVKKVKRSGELTIRDVITISPDSTLREAHEIMDQEEISGLPVVEDGMVIGIISRRDIEPIFNSDADRKVDQVMTRDVVTVDESITPSEALDIAYENKVERLPVVKDGRIVGILTMKDILERKRYPNASRDPEGYLRVAAATGPFDLERPGPLMRQAPTYWPLTAPMDTT